MNNSKIGGIVGVLALLMIIGSRTITLSDFLSGFILGIGIVLELVAIYSVAKSMKKKDHIEEDK